MNKGYLLCLLLLSGYWLRAQDVTVSGYVKDALNGEALIGVSVYTESPRYGAVTNAYGFYSLTIPKGKYNIIYSYLGYVQVTNPVTLKGNITINISLSEASEELDEVVVTDKRLDENLKTRYTFLGVCFQSVANLTLM